MFACLDQADQATLEKEVQDAINEEDVSKQDRLVMELVKWFQYPQLMVSGSLAVESAREKIPMKIPMS